MIEFAGISEGYEYQHNATKNRKLNIRNARKFKIRDTFWTDHVYNEREHTTVIGGEPPTYTVSDWNQTRECRCERQSHKYLHDIGSVSTFSPMAYYETRCPKFGTEPDNFFSHIGLTMRKRNTCPKFKRISETIQPRVVYILNLYKLLFILIEFYSLNWNWIELS